MSDQKKGDRHQGIYVASVIDEKWTIQDLYRQTVAQARLGGSTSSAVIGNYNSPSKNSMLRYELDSKNMSSSQGKSKWILSLRFTGKEWELSLSRKSKTFMEEPLLVQLEIKVLKPKPNSGSRTICCFKDSLGPIWLPSHQKFLPMPKSTPVKRIMCSSCNLTQVGCSCVISVGSPICSDCCVRCCKSKSAAPELSEFNFKTWSVGNKSRVQEFLHDGALTISIRLEQLERNGQGTLSEIKARAEKKVVEDLGALLNSGIASDLEIKVNGEGGVKLFKAHQGILAARSPVFQRMFATEMLERLTGELVIEDISPDAVSITLKYIYSGSVDLDKNMEFESKERLVAELVYAANKWELNELKELIGSQMISFCDSNNAMKLLKFANQHQLTTAVTDIEGFIRNNIEDILAAKRPKII